MVANKWLMLGCASMALISSQALAQAPSTSDEVSKTDGPITQASDIVVLNVATILAKVHGDAGGAGAPL